MDNRYWDNLNNPNQTTGQESPSYGSPYQVSQPIPAVYAAPEGNPRPKKKKNGINGVLLVVICLIVSIVGGYFGSLLANDPVTGSPTHQGGTGVLYQTVERVTDSTGNSSAFSIPDIVAAIKASVVEIVIEEQTSSYFFQQYIETGAGSGVIISEDGYIVTCAHVVTDASNIKVTLTSGDQYPATLVGTPDEVNDIALLKINASGLTPAVIGNSDKLVVGEDAIVIGNPLGSLGGTVTTGIISALGREVTVEGQAMTLLQTNAAVNPGNSGGGIFNKEGELVGIINAKSFGEDVEGIGFAIPINNVKEIVEQLLEVGFVSTPVLGISAIEIGSKEAADQYGVERFGVYIDAVTPGKGADAAGLRQYDYILSMGGETINNLSDVTKVLKEHQVGDSIEVVIIREGSTITVTVVLSEKNV